MAQLTEAACLIEQGAMFPRRMGFRDAKGGTVLIGFKPGACSIYFDDEPIYHFDLDGRWQRAFIGCDPNAPDAPKNLAGVPGRHYLKGLGTATTSLVRQREGHEIKIHRKFLNFAETVDLDDHVRQMAMLLHARIATGELQPVLPPGEGRKAGAPVRVEELLDFLERIADWNAAAWSRQKERFEGTFGLLPMNPPVCPGPVVFQATLGDGTPNAIGFGGAASTPLYVRDTEEFQKHVQEVVHLWGRRLPQARGLYLAGPDLLSQPMPEVIGYLGQISSVLADSTIDIAGRLIDPPRTPQKHDIHLMTHRLDAPVPTVEMLTEYSRRGLALITLGVESVNQEIRSLYERTWTNADLAEWLTRAAEAQVPVNLVLLVGAGGTVLSETAEQVVMELDQWPLAPGTVIYLLDAADTAEELFTARVGISPNNAAALHELKESLLARLKPKQVKVAHSTLDKEWQ